MGMDHYAKVKDLGGTNGAFLARDRQQPDRLVVIKQLADGMQGIEELNASLRLRHPHIIRFHESFLYNGGLYVVMAYEPGGDLEELFRYLNQLRKTPTTHTLLLWFVQLLEALVFCHDHHVIHRDIKPGNIFVSEDTKLLFLGDFGSAKTLTTSDVTSTFVGSPMWISPEVLLGTKYSYAADVWSMGCVFYEMATLRKPFSAPSFAHLVQQVTRGHVSPLPPTIPEEVKSIIRSMLVLNPEQRAAAKEVLEVARAALTRAEEAKVVTPSPAYPSAASPPTSVSPSPTPSHHSPPQGHAARSSQSPQLNPRNAEVTSPSAKASRQRSSAPALTLTGASTPHASSSVTPKAAAAGASSRRVLVKRRPGASSASTERCSPSSTPSITAAVAHVEAAPSPSPQPPSPPAVVVVPAAPEPKSAERADAPPVERELELCPPMQLVLQIPIDDFRRPAPRKKAAPKRANAAVQKSVSSQKRQQITSVSAPLVNATAAPSFARQLTATSLSTRRLSTGTPGAKNSPSDSVTPSRVSTGSHKTAKALPPRQVARRAMAAADNQCNPPRVPAESPLRRAAAAGNCSHHRGGRPQPQPMSIVPAAQEDAITPTSKWFNQRMRDLNAMENYLHQHRVDDDKVLETYDARHRKDDQLCEVTAEKRGAAPSSPAQRRLSPAKTLRDNGNSNAAPAVTPPRCRSGAEGIPSPPVQATPPQQQQQRRRAGGSPGEAQHRAVASPFVRQTSYARQASHPRGAAGSQVNSLSSTFNGRQASNARALPPMPLEEQLRNEEERVAAREKREAERQRMKDLITAQRAAAKKQKRKHRKSSVMGVDILLPDRMQNTPNGVAPVG